MIDPTLPTAPNTTADTDAFYDKMHGEKLRIAALELAVKTAVTSNAESTVDAARKFYAFLTSKE